MDAPMLPPDMKINCIVSIHTQDLSGFVEEFKNGPQKM